MLYRSIRGVCSGPPRKVPYIADKASESLFEPHIALFSRGYRSQAVNGQLGGRLCSTPTHRHTLMRSSIPGSHWATSSSHNANAACNVGSCHVAYQRLGGVLARSDCHRYPHPRWKSAIFHRLTAQEPRVAARPTSGQSACSQSFSEAIFGRGLRPGSSGTSLASGKLPWSLALFT